MSIDSGAPSLTEEETSGPVAHAVELPRWRCESYCLCGSRKGHFERREDGEWVKYEDAMAEVHRLQEALLMIAQETLCPDLWREEDRKDWSEGYLAHRTALVIAHAALEPAEARKSDG